MSKSESKVINLGCRLNFFESEVINNILKKDGIQNTIIINTCAVTNHAVKKSISEVKKASSKYPNHKILVTGCASQIDEKSFIKLKNVKKIIDNKTKTRPDHYNNHPLKEEKSIDFPYLDQFSTSRSRALLQIQQGCDHRCTFCIIPFGRGDSKSLPFEEICQRVSGILKKGFKEIILTGIDLTSYGHDLSGNPKLGNILKRLLCLYPELKRLRLSSIDPAEIDDDLLDLLLKDKRLLPHAHLSIQSGDNMILKRMKRRHNTEQVINLCKKIRSYRPEFTFGADVIVGFPTETDEHFSNTLKFVKLIDFSNVHVFPFSAKQGTPASRMPQVNEKVKKIRADILRRESKKLLHKKLDKTIGKCRRILFESHGKSYTDEFFKVKLTGKKNFDSKPGVVLDINVISRNDDTLVAELI